MEVIDNSIMVSVIIPNYNHAPFLTERIESVLNQAYQDFEVIILDDCSTDNSREIIEKYRNHPKISKIVYNETNSGSTFKQWQKGFQLARGEYIWIAESDDVADHEFLSLIVPRLQCNPNIVLGFSNIDMINQDGIIIGNGLSSYMPKPIVDGEFFIKHNMLFGCNILNASSAIFRKDTLGKISSEYMSFKSAGDYLFWVQIASHGKIFKSPKVLDHFRQHKNKVTPKAVATGIQFVEAFKIFQKIQELIPISWIERLMVSGFWMQRIETDKDKISSNEIYTKCLKLWSTKHLNKFCKFIYLLNGIGRFIKKEYLGYKL